MCPNFEMEIKDGRRLIFLLSCPKIWNAHRLNSIQWEKLNRNHTIWLAPTKKTIAFHTKSKQIYMFEQEEENTKCGRLNKSYIKEILRPNGPTTCTSVFVIPRKRKLRMKWNELVKSSQFLVWNLCYHCIRRPKVQWFYFLIFNIHLDCFSLRSSIIIKANDHSTLSESIFDYAAWKGTTILRTK